MKNLICITIMTTPAQSCDLELDKDSKRRTSSIFQPVRSPLGQKPLVWAACISEFVTGKFISENFWANNLPIDVSPVKIHSCSQGWCSEQQKCKYLKPLPSIWSIIINKDFTRTKIDSMKNRRDNSLWQRQNAKYLDQAHFLFGLKCLNAYKE